MNKIYRIFFCIAFAILLPLQAQEPELVVPIGHTAGIEKAVFTKDGSKIFTASNDNTIKCWDVNSGKLLRTYEGHSNGIMDIALNTDETLLASASRDQTARIWNIRSGKSLHIFTGYERNVSSVAFNSASTELLTCSWDGTVKTWDVNSGELLENINAIPSHGVRYGAGDTCLLFIDDNHRITHCITSPDAVTCYLMKGHSQYIVDAFFFNNFNNIISASRDSTVIIWNAKANSEILHKLKCDFPIEEFHISPDEKYMILIADGAPYAELYSLDSFTPVGKFGELNRGYSNRIKAAFSPDSKRMILSLSETEKTYIYDISDKIQITDTVFTNHGILHGIAVSPDGSFFTLNSHNDTGVLWGIGSKAGEKRILCGFSEISDWARSILDDSFTLVNSGNRKVELWDNFTHKPLYRISDGSLRIYDVFVSPDENFFATVNQKSGIKFWHTRNGKLLGTLLEDNPEEYPDGVQVVPIWLNDGINNLNVRLSEKYTHTPYGFSKCIYSADGQYFAAASDQSEGIAVWNIKSRTLVVNILTGAEGITDICFSGDGQSILISGTGGALILYDLIKRKWSILKGHKSYMLSGSFLGEERMISTDGGGIIHIWDRQKRKKIKSIHTYEHAKFALYRPDLKKIITHSRDTLQIWDADNYKLLYSDNLQGESIREIVNTPNSDYIFISFMGSFDKKTPPCLFNIKTNELYGFYDEGLDGQVSYNGQNTITRFGVSVSRWDLWTNKYMSGFVTVNEDDQLVKSPGLFYSATPGAAKRLHYISKDLDIIAFEQLDVKYNRPDLVLRSIGNPDTTLIQSYFHAWQKRIKKLGIDTTQFQNNYSIPQCIISNRSDLNYLQNTGNIQIRISSTDSNFILDRFNLWVNESPIFGQSGMKLRNRNSRHFDTGFTITLSEGINSIETSVMNRNGVESYRKPLLVKYIPIKPEPYKVHFIGMGMDKFSDSTFNLRYSVKDIRDLATAFKQRYGDTLVTDTLFNAQVTKENLSALKKKLLNCGVNDKVIIAYSGHGLLSKELDYYLSTYNVNFEHPESNGLPYEDLENLLDSIPARQKLMLIDACHSGEVDKDEMLHMYAVADSLGLSKGTRVTNTKKETKTMGLQNSFELMQNLFVNVGKGTGATVISASAGTQFALERGDLKNGVFTYSILEAMSKYPDLTVSQLKSSVGLRVVELTRGMQKPTSRNETINNDWRVW